MPGAGVSRRQRRLVEEGLEGKEEAKTELMEGGYVSREQGEGFREGGVGVSFGEESGGGGGGESEAW